MMMKYHPSQGEEVVVHPLDLHLKLKYCYCWKKHLKELQAMEKDGFSEGLIGFKKDTYY